MILYHFTSERHLSGIAKHGLTVGDIPTDIVLNKGRVGVWLTSSEQPTGHGLGGSRANKLQYRLRVSVDESQPHFHKWTDWAAKNVTAATIEHLHGTAAGFDTWFIYLSILPPDRIIECHDTEYWQQVSDWRTINPPDALPAVPAWRRAAWHKSLLKQVGKELKRQGRG